MTGCQNCGSYQVQHMRVSDWRVRRVCRKCRYVLYTSPNASELEAVAWRKEHFAAAHAVDGTLKHWAMMRDLYDCIRLTDNKNEIVLPYLLNFKDGEWRT